MLPNHYEVLGVRPDADRAEIRARYLATMRETHPDRHPGDATAEARARAANAAWHVLRDHGRRAAYDRALRVGHLLGPRVQPGFQPGFQPTVRPSVWDTPMPTPRQAARAHHAARLRHAFHRATLRVGGLILLSGLVLLLLTAAR